MKGYVKQHIPCAWLITQEKIKRSTNKFDNYTYMPDVKWKAGMTDKSKQLKEQTDGWRNSFLKSSKDLRWMSKFEGAS